jgi:hypothetical protein
MCGGETGHIVIPVSVLECLLPAMMYGWYIYLAYLMILTLAKAAFIDFTKRKEPSQHNN